MSVHKVKRRKNKTEYIDGEGQELKEHIGTYIEKRKKRNRNVECYQLNSVLRPFLYQHSLCLGKFAGRMMKKQTIFLNTTIRTVYTSFAQPCKTVGDRKLRYAGRRVQGFHVVVRIKGTLWLNNLAVNDTFPTACHISVLKMSKASIL